MFWWSNRRVWFSILWKIFLQWCTKNNFFTFGVLSIKSLAFWSLDKLHRVNRVVVRMWHTVALIRLYLATKSQIIDQQPPLSEKSRSSVKLAMNMNIHLSTLCLRLLKKYGIQAPASKIWFVNWCRFYWSLADISVWC